MKIVWGERAYQQLIAQNGGRVLYAVFLNEN